MTHPYRSLMPCYDPETHARPERLEKKVHFLTAMLCALCGNVEVIDPKLLGSHAGLKNWWENHKAQDERIAKLRETLKHHGREALTRDEQTLLWRADDVSY